jgi:hypothetical protein
MSVQLNKRVGFNFAPIQRVLTAFSKNVNNTIQTGSILSTKFMSIKDGIEYVVSIKEIAGTYTNSTIVNGQVHRLVRLGTFTENGILIEDIGSANMTNGHVDISFAVYKYITASRFISLRLSTVDKDIDVKRNQIVAFAPNVIDLPIGLSDNNIVMIELD